VDIDQLRRFDKSVSNFLTFLNLSCTRHSQGWAGFHVINMRTPLNSFRDLDWSPAAQPALDWDGNTAHSTAFWHKSAAAFYVGGWVRYGSDGRIESGPGNGNGASRDTCLSRTINDCKPYDFASFRMTNTKVFLATVYAWVSRIFFVVAEPMKFDVSLIHILPFHQFSTTGRFDLEGFEAHDTGMLQKQSDRGFWMDRVLHACRSGEQLQLPEGFNTERWSGSSMSFQTEGYKYIISNSIFRNCGVRVSRVFSCGCNLVTKLR